MSQPLKLERPQLLTDLVFERLREAVVTGDIKLGEQVSEAQLAARLGTSKTPVREALVRLKRDGLVDIQAQRGTFIFRLSPDEVGHLCTYRVLIETEALRTSYAADRTRLIAAWKICVDEMRLAEKRKDTKALARIDMEFHWQLFSHCPNAYLASAYELIRYQLMALRHRSPIHNAVDSHQILVEALESGSLAKACKLLANHILENEPRYRISCGLD